MPTDPPVRPVSAEERAQHLEWLDDIKEIVACDLSDESAGLALAALDAAIATLRADPEAREREAFMAGRVGSARQYQGTWCYHEKRAVNNDDDVVYAAYRAARAQEPTR